MKNENAPRPDVMRINPEENRPGQEKNLHAGIRPQLESGRVCGWNMQEKPI